MLDVLADLWLPHNKTITLPDQNLMGWKSSHRQQKE